ncbi:MAG TPA: SRPBCC family protein [Gemmatimonadales bacterium]|nr:SRPBCC family protein [Gemmatimonadales bacterium]
MTYYLDPRQGAARRGRLTAWIRDLLSELSDDGRSRGLGHWRTARQPSGHYGSRAGDIGGLEAANLDASSRGSRLGQAAAIGLMLAVWGLTRRGVVGFGARAAAAGLVLRRLKGGPAAADVPVERRRTVDIQKTLRIEAPVEQVYAFWRDYRNFPLFLSRVRRVEDLGAGRSRWVMDGPDGALEWNAVITVEAPDSLLAWRSEPGAVLENAGAVRFSREGTGTRLDLRFCYNPPTEAGAAVAELFGADPRAQLNQDLGRLKSLLESGTRSELYGQESGT